MAGQITAGPWHIKDDYTREGRHTIIANVDESHFDFVASCIDEYDETTEATSANVRAITAVPDMIAALQFYASNWQANGDGDSSTPGLSRTWQEPTDELISDEGQKAAEALRKAGVL